MLLRRNGFPVVCNWMVHQELVDSNRNSLFSSLCFRSNTAHLQYDPKSLESKGMWLITAAHTETIHQGLIKTHLCHKTHGSTKLQAASKLIKKIPFISVWYYNVFCREILSNTKSCVRLCVDVKYTSQIRVSTISPQVGFRLSHTSTNAIISYCHLRVSYCITLVRME